MNLLRRLLRSHASAPVPAVVPASQSAAVETPAYFEVWGGLERANRALWAGLWFAITVALLCLALVRLLLTKPPVVIRVSDSGSVLTESEPGRQPPVSEAEIKNFLTLFERFFFGLNVHTYDADLKLAFAMMTEAFQGKANDMLKSAGTVAALKANEGRVVVTLTELKVQRDTAEVLECKVRGSRQIGSFKADGQSGRVVFEHDIILRKTPRSGKAPYGVLVDDFHESVYEDTLKKD